MFKQREFIERRKFKRYPAMGGAFVALSGGAHRMGQILDISDAGLAFNYIDDEVKFEGACKLELFIKDNDFHLENLRFKTIADLEQPKKFPSCVVKVRRRGVQFKNLNQDHKSLIGYFIKNHTIGKF